MSDRERNETLFIILACVLFAIGACAILGVIR